MNRSFSTRSINASKLLIFVFSFLKFTFEDFASIGGFPSWRTNEFDIFVVWFTFIELVSAGFETRYLSLLKKLSKSRLKLYQFISVGIGINDGPFLSKDFSACNKSLLLKLIAFWSGHVVSASSIIFLSFSRYNNYIIFTCVT